MKQQPSHPLDGNEAERAYFARVAKPGTGLGAAAYRRAVLACTGSLPTWAEKQKPGPKPRPAAENEQ